MILVDIALAVLIAALCLWIGWDDYLLVQIPTVMLAGAAGIWLFYVQHQFEDTYWQSSDDWSYAEAALQGSSYLKLPKVLQFFSGNIGLHHVHHLSARVPNYNLPRAHEANPVFHDVPTLTLWDGLHGGAAEAVGRGLRAAGDLARRAAEQDGTRRVSALSLRRSDQGSRMNSSSSRSGPT